MMNLLKPKYPGNLKVISFKQCDSTNDYLRSHYGDLKIKLPVMVTTGLQTAGRGRDKRTWVSSKGKGLYSSFGFELATDAGLQYLPLIAGITVIETLREICGMDLGLKWPNDILYKGKKIAGILIENVIYGPLMYCITGMGINLNYIPADFPDELKDKATSLKMLTGKTYNPDKINPLLAKTFFNWLENLKNNRHALIISTVNRYGAILKDREIRFHHNKEIITGIYKGINTDGGLLLDTKEDSNGEGANVIYYSGEIV
ncbi:MAG: biotin--[acetyl-CoA-carboxylase] ligase [bacterium]|nr:biotin--[acetyl-CoA-carboxylase] ligase [bacterium]